MSSSGSAPVLETRRLILRRWQPSDQDPFARLNADPRVMEYMPALLTTAQSQQFVSRIEEHFRRLGYGLFATALRGSDEFIGYIGLNQVNFAAPFTAEADRDGRPVIEIGWRLAAEHWGRGLATEGARAVLDFAFSALHLPEVVSFTAAANIRSRRVMEKIGLQHQPEWDFDHPRLEAGHPLQRHVLYRTPPPTLTYRAAGT